MRTLKDEEVRIRDYADFADTRRFTARYLDNTYNNRRLRSSLDCRPPTEFETFIAEPVIIADPA